MRIHLRAFAIALVVASIAHILQAQPRVSDQQLREFDQFVVQWMANEHVPVLTIGFFKGDQYWVKSFGFSDVENQVRTTNESAYRYASVQKTMTAVAVLQLAERKQLDLDAEIQTYVPYFPREPYPITARQLLGHLGGIPHYVNRDAEQHITTHKTTREAIAIFENFDLVAEPGTRYSYSSYGYNLLGAAIEGASKQSYGDYMREHVWGPAGMRNTRLDDPRAIIPHRVRGYRFVDGALQNSEFIDVSSRFAAGGSRGTVPDLLAFLRALNGEELLSAPSLQMMVTPGKTKDGQPTAYGLGWQIPNFVDRETIVANDGGQQETRTFILNETARDFGMALAMNFEADNYGPVIMRLYELANGRPLRFAEK
jgi:CubicO group peptidase (beta-lactamase class C family)